MIRAYTEGDLEQVLNVWEESSSLAHPFLHSAFVEQVKSDMKNLYIPNSKTWVYETDSAIVGFISMADHEIGGLFVLSTYHGKGIGTMLVNFVREFHDKLEVEVFEKNNIGRVFYDKYGFSLVKSYLHEQSGERVLRLRK